jgi:hypothetical protein
MGHGFGVLGGRIRVSSGWRFFRLSVERKFCCFTRAKNPQNIHIIPYLAMMNLKMIVRFELSTV